MKCKSTYLKAVLPALALVLLTAGCVNNTAEGNYHAKIKEYEVLLQCKWEKEHPGEKPPVLRHFRDEAVGIVNKKHADLALACHKEQLENESVLGDAGVQSSDDSYDDESEVPTPKATKTGVKDTMNNAGKNLIKPAPFLPPHC